VSKSKKNAEQNAYMSLVMDQLLGDLQNPVGKDGTVLYTEPFKAILAWHLVRAGWRKPNTLDQLALREEFDDPVIKKRAISGPGVMEDAVEWVGFSEPDDPLEHLDDMTMGQINALPEHLRIEAKRRQGLIPERPRAEDIPNNVRRWSVKPVINISADSELGDVNQLS